MREDLTEKVTIKERSEGGMGINHVSIWRKYILERVQRPGAENAPVEF